MKIAPLYHRRYQLGVLLGLLLIISLLIPALSVKAATYTVTIDGSSAGRQFDGVGAVSGGGGTSRLLIDYPEPQRSQILDYLFKPNYGASLQILKVEIGGDADSTQGAEATHQRTATDQNYTRGYEWWLMQEAKARNPNIKLAGLAWTAPGWLSGGMYSTDYMNYLINWIKHAKSDYNLTIDYIGGTNEGWYDVNWFKNFRTALNNAGLSSVKVIAADAWDGGVGASWPVATDMTNDAAFNAAVDIIGDHYTCGAPQGDEGVNCSSPANAQALGKPLWASESGSKDANTGAGPMAMGINRGYIDAKTVAYLNWNLVAAYYDTFPYPGTGLMKAPEPWSGSYDVSKSIWVMAHTAQFTQPGWHYLDTSSGYLGGSRTNGSYVSLKSTNNTDYTVVIETVQATAANTVNFTVTGGLSTGVVHVWATNMSGNLSSWFLKQSDITPSNGVFSITLEPNYLYTITTTTGQGKGAATPPGSSTMALPYVDDFNGYALSKIPKYFATVMGAFEAATCVGGHSGICMQQDVDLKPNTWCCGGAMPETIMGDSRWTNYTVSTDVLLPQAGSVELFGRVTGQYEDSGGTVVGYHLQLSDTGAWKLYYTGVATTLASGTVSYGTNTWTTLKLIFNGSNIQAAIGGTTVANVTDSSAGNGQAGVGTNGWYKAQFDNFNVYTNSPAPTNTPTITPGGPTLTPSNTPTKTLTPTTTNTPGPGMQVEIQGGNTDTNSQTAFNVQLRNTGQTTLSNVSWRLYFTTENGNAGSSYALEKYYDQTGAATISGPTQACGSIYYITVSYGTMSMPTGAVWGYSTAFHLASWGSTYDSSNDWWHTGYVVGSLPSAFMMDRYIPGYNNGTLLWGNEPNCTGAATATPTLTLGVTKTSTPTQTARASSTRTSTPLILTPTNTLTFAVTPTKTLTPMISLTPTSTLGASPTRTFTPLGPTMTSTRTPTTGPTLTLTTGPTATRTNTALPVTATPTVGTGACSPVTSTITAPFTYDGAGTFCWQSSNLGTYINSWNTASVIVNGVNETNLYVAVGSLPAKINGYWYVSYNSSVAWAHFEAK